MENIGSIGFVIVMATLARWGWLLWNVKIPKSPIVFQALWAAGLLLGALSIYQGYDNALASWAVGVGLVFLFLSSTGKQRVDGDMVAVGDTIPAFSAPDQSNTTFDSASLAGSRVLLKFFRGHW
jgi:hypothetical protein